MPLCPFTSPAQPQVIYKSRYIFHVLTHQKSKWSQSQNPNSKSKSQQLTPLFQVLLPKSNVHAATTWNPKNSIVINGWKSKSPLIQWRFTFPSGDDGMTLISINKCPEGTQARLQHVTLRQAWRRAMDGALPLGSPTAGWSHGKGEYEMDINKWMMPGDILGNLHMDCKPSSSGTSFSFFRTIQ